MVVHGTNAGAIVPAALDHMRLGTSGALLSSCKGPRCLIRTKVPGLHVHPGCSGGGVESSSEEGAAAPSLVRLIAALGRPRMPRMREVARPGWVGAGCST